LWRRHVPKKKKVTGNGTLLGCWNFAQ